MSSEAVVIIVFALFTAALAELLNWLFIYNTSSYQTLKTNIERKTQKLEKMQEEGGATNEKRAKKMEGEVRALHRDMQMVRMKSGIPIMIAMVMSFNVLSSMMSGKVIARIPFEPFGFFQRISHRNLLGSDYTEASFHFVYVLASLSIRTNLQKLLGVTPPPAGKYGMFAPPKRPDE